MRVRNSLSCCIVLIAKTLTLSVEYEFILMTAVGFFGSLNFD